MTSTDELDIKHIPYSLRHHAGSAHSAAEAADVLGLTVNQIVKTLLLIGKSIGPIIILATGDQRLNMDQLRHTLNDRTLHFATKEEVLNITGYQIGLVTPLGLKTLNIPVCATPEVERLQDCAISSGQLGTEIQLQAAHLLQATSARILGRM